MVSVPEIPKLLLEAEDTGVSGEVGQSRTCLLLSTVIALSHIGVK